MLGLDYGSDSENETDDIQSSVPSAPNKSSAPAPAKAGSSLSLPPPKASSSLPGGLNLPPPKTKKPKKIAIGLPALSAPVGDDAPADTDGPPPAKKPRRAAAGASSLLAMLPAPSKPIPAAAPKPQRVLGGGTGPSLVFNTPVATSAADVPEADGEDMEAGDDIPAAAASASAMSFLPASLGKGKKAVNLEAPERAPAPRAVAAAPALPSAPAVDFFSLGSSSVTRTAPRATITPSAAPTVSSAAPTVSSAPAVEDFTPPEPKSDDPYPGYYQLPSGTWAAHDPAYYQSFYNRWKKEYDAQVRALEKGAKGFEAYDADAAREVNAEEERERARVEVKEREERKALTSGPQGAPEAPRMNVQGAKLGRAARSRHQLTTLLTEAYSNREALEERIAQGKRNRKEAGTKYGF